MAWDWGTIFEYGAPIVGGLLEREGSRDASRAAQQGSREAIAEQRRQFDTVMGLLQPQMQVGNQALNALARLYNYNTSPLPGPTGVAPPTGVPTPTGAPSSAGRNLGSIAGAGMTGSPFAILPELFSNRSRAMNEDGARMFAEQWGPKLFGDKWPAQGSGTTVNGIGGPVTVGNTTPQPNLPTGMDVFSASPDYQFRRNEGMRGIENSFAARGGAASGNALRALTEFNSGLASGEFGNFFNRQAALAGIGQTATNQGVGAAQSTGANVGNLLMGGANARASGIEGSTNALSGILQNLLSVYNRRNQSI
jgi:hypothetical protein